VVVLVLLFLPNMPSIQMAGVGRVLASIRHLFDRSRSAQVAAEPHVIHFPYFVSSDEMASTLTLNNNMTEEATVGLTLFNMDGRPLNLAPISLAPQLPARFDLRQLANNPDFESGNVQVTFNGISMGVTGQVSVISTSNRLAFESPRSEAMDFASSQLQGIVWVPDHGSQARLALTNTTDAVVTVTGRSTGNTQSDHEASLVRLEPHATRLLQTDDFLSGDQDTASSAALVTLQYDGSPGAVMVTGFAINRETGFSCNLPFVDPATAVSTRLAGAHVRIGTPDPKEGFPSGTRFSAPLILANAGGQRTQATINIDYTAGSSAHHAQVGVISLDPGQTQRIDLTDALAASGVVGLLNDAGVDVTYTGALGSVIGRLTSFDQSKDFAFDVPVKDPLAGAGRNEGSYPWRLDNGYTTVVHLKNTTNSAVRAIVQVRYAGGNYNPDRVTLAPFQTVAIDIKGLRDSQLRDIRGGVMPGDIESGQVVWYELTPSSLIGRAEVFNVPQGIASSFSCGGSNCTPSFHSPSMSPTSATLSFGSSSAPFTPQETDIDCQSVLYGPFNITNGITWSSTNNSVATVGSDGTVTPVTPGTVTILAGWTATIYQCQNGCVTTTANPQASGAITLKPTISAASHQLWWFNGENPTGYTTQLTLACNQSGSSYNWVVGGNLILNFTLSNNTGPVTTTVNNVTIEGVGESQTIGDTNVSVLVNGATSDPYTITVLAPNNLNPGAIQNQVDPTFAYLSLINYTIRDKFGHQLPSDVPVNESWTSGIEPDYFQMNWRMSTAGGFVAPSAAFADHIQGEVSTMTPTPLNPQNPLGTIMVCHWGQQWQVGSVSSGNGRRVQTDTFQKYQDHALHLNIVSPAP
jgi:hypothetical protein